MLFPQCDTPMKICVFSDSHGSAREMLRAARVEDPDLVFFLGDGENDLTWLRRVFPKLPVLSVRGNCDLRSKEPYDLECAVGGFRFFATHGHRYDVKHDPYLEELAAAGAEHRANVILFGHTHEPYRENRNGVLFLNPGSVGESSPPSYAVITVEDGGIKASIRTLA